MTTVRFQPHFGPRGDSLVSGDTWNAFADAIRDAGKVVLAEHAPASREDRAEGFRYLSRLVNASLSMFVEFADPDYPEFGRLMDTSVKWGLDNIDALYGKCSIRGEATYRIRGTGGTAHYLGFYATAGQFGDPVLEGKAAPGSVVGVINNLDLEYASDGSFEIIVSADEQPGNWMKVDPAATGIGVRQFFYDWDNEIPWRLSIERIGAEGPPPALTAEQLDRRMRNAIKFINPGCDLWDGLARSYWAQPPNDVVMIERGRSLTDPYQDYGFGHFRLEPDEALIVEFTPPQCHYWSCQIYNWWGESFDYTYRQSSLNGYQARLDTDGRFRGVICAVDPGVPNWIDTAGHSQGMLCPRFLLADEVPPQRYRVVRLSGLRKELSAETPEVSAAERADVLRRRRNAVWRRFRD
jgi:hypothetical protein